MVLVGTTVSCHVVCCVGRVGDNSISHIFSDLYDAMLGNVTDQDSRLKREGFIGVVRWFLIPGASTVHRLWLDSGLQMVVTWFEGKIESRPY